MAFICTQTDDVEPTEIWRDHSDVAYSKPGRGESLCTLFESLAGCERRQKELDAEKDQKEESIAGLTWATAPSLLCLPLPSLHSACLCLPFALPFAAFPRC